MTNRVIRTLVILAAILLVPIVPFVLFGQVLEPWIDAKLTDPFWEAHPLLTSLAIIGSLVADILLPIPSSNVCTFAGRMLGGVNGTIVCWLGLNLSCAFGYFLAFFCGWPIAKRLSSESALTEMKLQIERYGIGTLFLFRAVPVLAEATVVLMGVYRMSAARFWPPVIAANLGLAFAYCTLGNYASKHGWFGLAMSIAFALPAAILAIWWLWPDREKPLPPVDGD